ncbi:DNA polymerase III subunit beta [Streptomyces sp. BR123]|uniref:DNA polymerase III subunit beta n=1 Tax=Streptomyces sp. BR123 TaxID=2749828 RepID=UPI0015C4855D|nr:DNA polymerase III subunit beta [Streptomyces sp. BR123]NXY98211.1 DNA polymerase III subunit beta [Streptomyces sp. BR123]
MKLTLTTETLTDALRLVGRRIPARPAAPTAAGLQLTADGQQLSLTASGEPTLAVRTAVPASVHVAGTGVLPGRMLTAIARTLPAKAPLDITVETGIAHFAFGASSIAVPLLDGDYPAMPDLPRTVGTVGGREFAAAVNQVAVTVGTDDTLPMLMGIRVELVGHELRLSSTDRHRASFRSIPIERTARRAPSQVCVVPGKALRATAADLRHAETVTIGLPAAEGQRFSVSTPGMTVAHTPLEASHYPDLGKLTPKTFATTAVLNRMALVEVVRRAVAVAGDYVPVCLTIQPGAPVVVAGGSCYEARTRDELDARSVKGEPIRLALSPTYLLGGLRALKSRTVQLSLTRPDRPVLLHTPGSGRDALCYLLMPVRQHSDAPTPN